MASVQKKNATGVMQRAKPLAKVPTGVEGLDEVLAGGFPQGRLTVITGGPGTGKSLFALESLYRAALKGERGIFVSLEEPASSIRENAATLGWDLAVLEKKKLLHLVETRLDPRAVRSGDFTLMGLMAVIDGFHARLGVSRVVIDAPDALLHMLDDPILKRAELYGIHNWLRERRFTTIITVRTVVPDQASSEYDLLEYMCDCAIKLDLRVKRQVATRRLRVLKYRGSSFGANEYPYGITERGIYLLPVTSSDLRHVALGKPISSGHPKLDEILGGGYPRASCTVVSGSSGTGKTTLASSFAHHACSQKLRTLYIDFEESQDAIVAGMLSPGIDLRPALKSGWLRFLSCLPESMGVEEHLIRAYRALRDEPPDIVIVDAISACQRMGSEQAGFEYLLRLIGHCKNRGITTFLTNLTASRSKTDEITGIDLSSVIDTVVLLRHVESRGEMNRSLFVLKSRGQKHSNKTYEYRITSQGIEILDPYVDSTGLLTGAERAERESEVAATRRKTQTEIERMRHAVAQQRALLHAEQARLSAELASAEERLVNAELEQTLEEAPSGAKLSRMTEERRRK